ncbi:MAG: hypothetical protein EOP00_34040 [Pedobacter sp.]|nr:MAG: hypothetical protein EOP00_34040 [Pedobacter sp.]
MRKYMILLGLILASVGLNAQLKISNNLATSALNSNVTKTVNLTTVNNTIAANNNNSGALSGPSMGSLSSTTVGDLGTAFSGNYLVSNTSKFGYYTPYYAEIITVATYSRYYQNIPLQKYFPYGEYYQQSITWATRDLNLFLPHYKYFLDGKPGYSPYLYDKPSSIFIDVGITKPTPLQVDPSSQAYSLNNTRFVKSFTLSY